MPIVRISDHKGGFFDRLPALVLDKQVQLALLYNIFQFGFVIASFVIFVTTISVSLSLMSVILYPLLRLILQDIGIDIDQSIVDIPILRDFTEILVLGLFSILGFFLFIISLHLIRFLAFAQVKLLHQTL